MLAALDYDIDRESPTLSGGELQRLRPAGQLRSGLFGVVYILDEPLAARPGKSAAIGRWGHIVGQCP